jgi:hypothetical protein
VLTPPKLPAIARLGNRIGGLATRIGLPVLPLDEERLLEQASRAAGENDSGPDTFREGLRKFIAALESDAHLSTLGRLIARKDIGMTLENRLGVLAWHKRHPEISRQEIRRPIVIIGMARTGTTILHHLITQDPNVRVPLTWEVDRPCPPPESATYDADPRIDEVERTLARSESLIPDFRRMHPMGARLAQECVRITSLEFASMLFQTVYRVPSYARWLHDEADLGPAYRIHRQMLQLLQWRCPRGRWVLKSPGHLWSLPALLAEYPDACLVATHRDPLKVLSSVTSLTTTLRAMASERIDPGDIAREWSYWNARAFDAAVAARESGLVKPEQVIDVQFGELLSEPIEVIRKIYDKFGLELTEVTADRMQRHLAENPDDKHGKHGHSFADTGLDREMERAKVRRYQEYFGVESERL